MNSLSSFRKPVSHKSMGIEIECGVSYDNQDFSRHRHYGFFYAGTDGSISIAANATEFVSQPLTKNWLIKEICKLEKRIGGWTTNRTCGIHIHVSRKWLSTQRAKLVYEFYCGLTNVQREELFGRGSNVYCCTNKWNTSRYNAVNNENTATIELRMFASGNAAWAVYCVKMAEYLVSNAKHLNLDAALAFSTMHNPNYNW